MYKTVFATGLNILILLVMICFYIAGPITSVQADILSGWSMLFFDFECDKELNLKLAQRQPAGEDTGFPENPGTPDAPAIGDGFFSARGIRATLIVTRASWNEWNDEAAFPESAFVRGYARLGFFNWKPFTIKLISNKFPGPEQTNPYDEADIEINGVIYHLRGELHHGRLRALLAPSRSSLGSPEDKITVTWGSIKKQS
ncbi:hypothetical protein GF312_01785 [Candidatus Poribacteria bacterium]|nr:hypothetical protein [Candidatus Poribacteria bacterium]